MTSLRDAYILRTNSSTRKRHDYYPTAPVATFALHSCIKVIPQPVWEPAAGRGWMSKELIRCGHKVVSTDLYVHRNPFVPIKTGVDFFETTKSPRKARAIITNPPYRKAGPERFFAHALALDVDFLALYCRINFLEGESRRQLFEQHPPRILMLSSRTHTDEKRLSRGEQIGGMVAHAWFVWDFAKPLKEPKIEFVNVKGLLSEWT